MQLRVQVNRTIPFVGSSSNMEAETESCLGTFFWFTRTSSVTTFRKRKGLMLSFYGITTSGVISQGILWGWKMSSGCWVNKSVASCLLAIGVPHWWNSYNGLLKACCCYPKGIIHVVVCGARLTPSRIIDSNCVFIFSSHRFLILFTSKFTVPKVERSRPIGKTVTSLFRTLSVIAIFLSNQKM